VYSFFVFACNRRKIPLRFIWCCGVAVHETGRKSDAGFKLHAEYRPTGDQLQAIETLVKGFREGNQFQTLPGVTGSGKTFTMANVIEQLQKPTLVIAHNKTPAVQLYGEFKEFFPENAVEYFVSYYDRRNGSTIYCIYKTK